MQTLSVKDRVAGLLPLVLKSDTAKSIVQFLAERDRHRTNTDLKRLKYEMFHAGLLTDDRDFVAFWEELGRSGAVGHYIRATTVEEPVLKNGKPVLKDGVPVVSKSNKSPKFHWAFSCKAFGLEMIAAMKAANIPLSTNASLTRLEAQHKKFKELPAQVEANDTKVSMRLSLGKAKIFVPHGFSKADAEMLSKKLFALVK